MELPYKTWGATAVFSGHQHAYERIVHDDGMHYIVNGLGGHPWIYEIHNCDVATGSQIRYNEYHGAMLGLVTKNATSPSGVQLDMCFYSIGNDGTLVDHFVLQDGNKASIKQGLSLNDLSFGIMG